MKKENIEQEIKQKAEYIGLDLEQIPETLKLVEDLKFKPPVGLDEKKYRQYRYVSPKEIEILLSPTNRLEDVKEKYSQAKPLIAYLLRDNEENIERNNVFLNMLKEVQIEDIEKIEKEQQILNKKIPFKVRYPGNYLWQIYYSQVSDKYFMIVPTEDKDYSTFFYVLKKQVEKKKAGKIFVPINNADYTKELLNKTEIQSLENYLWLFTKDWPSIYEVYDKTEKISLHIVGQTEVYGKIKSEYKVKLTTKIEATKFFKLVKALFILESELPMYYKFETQIDKQGSIEFYYQNKKIEYDELSDWVNEQYKRLLEIQSESIKENAKYKERLQKLKQQSEQLEAEYISKEKQISTFLECKKTFFGKVKYFFKYSGKKSKKKEEIIINKKEIFKEELEKVEDEAIKRQYTLDELLEKGKIANEKETNLKNTKMDINALKLKNVNLVKKIENATSFINEIDSHKKSIFEFWKYSNKDEVHALEEGEEEPINVKPHSKVFNYEDDFEEFGNTMDKIQREIFNKEELDSIYLATTEQVKIMNKLKTNTLEPKELEKWLKQIKTDLKNEKDLTEEDVLDIFGGLSEDTQKVAKLANKTHREQPKNKYSILRISKATQAVDYKVALNNATRIINDIITKNKISQEILAYMCTTDDENIDVNAINVFNLNSERELEKALKEEESLKLNLYKMNLQKGTNIIAFTNSIYYDNQNKTLPLGMDRDTRIIVKLTDMDLQLNNKKTIRIGMLEDEEDAAAKLIIKTVNIIEYTIKEIEKIAE